MLNYVNSVSCTTNENKNEFILTFRQIHPFVGADGTIKENVETVVSEIVMNHDLAVGLKGLIDKVLSGESAGQ